MSSTCDIAGYHVEMDALLTFGEWIEDRYRERYGGQTEFARAIDVGQSTVSSWVNHKRPPSRRNRVRIAGALGVSVDEVNRRVAEQVWENDADESSVSESKEVSAAPRRKKVHWLAGVPAMIDRACGHLEWMLRDALAWQIERPAPDC